MKKRKDLYYSDENAIKDLLLGRKIKKVSDNTLLLDNGMELQFTANAG
jgi:hypothetical protein